MMTRRSILLALGPLLWGSALGQLANQPPVPEWLEAPGGEREIQWEGTLLKAILLVAGEEEVRVEWNGEMVATVAPADRAVGVDVTDQVVDGRNQVRLVSDGAVSALLELNGDLAKKVWLATDESWASDGGSGVRALGRVDANGPDQSPFDFGKAFDAYNSWKLAARSSQQQATDPSTFTVPDGFKVELVRSAGDGEDSWVSLAFDPEGRVTLGMEKKGLLRLTLSGSGDQKVERIDDHLEECRGLLYADGWLFANANDSKALFRLRDRDGDGVFEEREELLRTGGGVGHGRNHLVQGPNGRIWLAHGNNVLLPESGYAAASPLQRYGEDQLIPNPWDGSMFDGNVELPAGHIVSMRPDGSDAQLFAGGLRNPLDIAFNREGELFTFDADMERDIGAPWYMPTRVLHVLPGSDFGWRRGTGRWPSHFADTLPSAVDVGLSSPTGIFFGYGAEFPAQYEEALYLCDWSYGRIVAIHLDSEGASYVGRQELFISGRPFNVTDGCVGPDGALWFTTGGRGTQSGLYRVRWEGELDPSDRMTIDPTPAQLLRRKLESGKASADEVVEALGSDDRFLRHAARLVLERKSEWLSREQITAEALGWRALETWLASVRTGPDELRSAAMEMAGQMPWQEASVEQQLACLRVLEVGLARGGRLEEPETLRGKLEQPFPARDPRLNQQLCKFLVYLESTKVVEKSMALLEEAEASEDLLFYPFVLRYAEQGWSRESRRTVFEALNRAEKCNGASTYFKAIADTRAELAARLAPEEAEALAAVISPPKPVALSAHALPRHTFRQWKLKDLEPQLAQVEKGRSYEGAKKALIAAQCVFCHRVGSDASLPAGRTGPDLTQVSARFGRRDLLEHILNPSLVIEEKFRYLTVTLSDGSQRMGAVESEDDERLILKPNPLADDVLEVGREMITDRAWSTVSPMPPGLLNGLKADAILDLLAYFEAMGNPDHPAFSK